MRLPPAERGEHVDKRDLLPFDRDGDPEVEPVVVVDDLVDGQADEQRIADLAVVGLLAGHLNGDTRLAGQQRQHFGGEAHGFKAGQPHRRCGCELGAAGRADPTEQAELGRRQIKVGEDGLLRVEVAIRRFIGCGISRESPRRLADLVGPLPAGLHFVAADVVGSEHQRRAGNFGRSEAAVR